MRGRRVWAGLLLGVVAAFVAGCADSDAYPNDQVRIEESLTDAGLESVSVTASEDWNLGDDSTDVTVSFTTPQPEPSEVDLSTIRRVVWEQFPHRLGYLVVEVRTTGGRESVDYSREQLEAMLGEQDFREDDSSPIFSSGMIAAIVIGCIVGLGFITYGVVQSRFDRKQSPEAVLPLPWPEPEPAPRANVPVAPRIEPPAPPAVTSRQPPPTWREPGRPSQRRNFEETVATLNAAWQWLADQVPDPPRKGRATYIDKWLADRGGIPVERIVLARRARNDAIHRPTLITRAAMDKAISIIDEVAERLHEQSDTG